MHGKYIAYDGLLWAAARLGLGITPHPPPLVTTDPAILLAIMVDLSSVKHTTLANGIMDERDALYRAQFGYYGQLLYRL